ncbi:unnamed protein product [Caenorhabditis angaria]|uniref:RING-type E3 ubiquitin transferase n=1 Tax=Caenorhabditis angaria TaxID=860376 RepID=A0A9P1IEU3_9PELO|nr:unnamed protein product [Caenorhabditis angaria]
MNNLRLNRVRFAHTRHVVKVLSLDARDTLIAAKEHPGVVYSKFAAEKGLHIDANQVFPNFLKNYKIACQKYPCFGYKTVGDREWWNFVVRNTLLDSAPGSSNDITSKLADELFDFYATKEPWKLVESDIRSTLQKFRLKGISLVVTSNTDSRLKSILKQFCLDDLFSMILLAGEVGLNNKVFQVMDLFRKPKKRAGAPTAVRQREDGSDEDETAVKTAIPKKRRNNPMVQSTSRKEKTARSSSDSDGDDDEIAVAEHTFAASGDSGPAGPRDSGATATLDIDTDVSVDAQAQFERVQQQLKEGLEKDGKVLYKGAALYGAKEAKDTAKGNASSGMNRIGPVRAPAFLRQTVRWDFAPDICKDYKETGFCTFGDSCKFVHDRSDYKHGWEIDKDFEEGKYDEDDNTDYTIKEEDEMYPEECYICGNAFVDPIVTKCKHYFCTDCAMKEFKKSAKCPICQQNTERIMNAARDLINHLKRKKAEQKVPSDHEEEEEEPASSNCEGHDHEEHHHHQEHREDYQDDSEENDEGEEAGLESDNDQDEPEVADEEQAIEMEAIDDVDDGEEDESESDGNESD